MVSAESDRRWRKAHPEKYREHKRRYRAANPEAERAALAFAWDGDDPCWK